MRSDHTNRENVRSGGAGVGVLQIIRWPCLQALGLS
jgi:hypothetical protein